MYISLYIYICIYTVTLPRDGVNELVPERAHGHGLPEGRPVHLRERARESIYIYIYIYMYAYAYVYV